MTTFDFRKNQHKLDWRTIVKVAAGVVQSYDTRVTLRQLYYQCVVRQLIANTDSNYKRLSAVTAAARREGNFPELVDEGRTVHRWQSFPNPAAAIRYVARGYRLDRTLGQDVSLYLAVEKKGIRAQLVDWFGDLGVPILAFGGYSSESYEREIANDVEDSGRDAAMIYAGDFDPSGMDILRNFADQMTARGTEMAIERIALNPEQIRQYNLPELPGKATDARAAGFRREHGKLVQVELDALDPNILRALYQEAIDRYWDVSAYETVLEREDAEHTRLLALCAEFK